MIEFTKPYFPRSDYNKPKIELCSNLKPSFKRDTLENPYQKILAKECLNWFNHSRVVALFHINPIMAEERFKAFVAFNKENMHIKVYGKATLKMALEGTKYEPFTQHYVSHNMLLFNPEPTIKPMLKILKKFPQLILLCKLNKIKSDYKLITLKCFSAAIYEGKYLSKDELVYVSTIPNLASAQAGFVQVLQSVGGGLVNKLNQCQNTLVNQLKEREKQLQENS